MSRCFLLVTTAIWFRDQGHNKNITQVIAMPYPRHYKTVRFSLILRTVAASFFDCAFAAVKASNKTLIIANGFDEDFLK